MLHWVWKECCNKSGHFIIYTCNSFYFTIKVCILFSHAVLNHQHMYAACAQMDRQRDRNKRNLREPIITALFYRTRRSHLIGQGTWVVANRKPHLQALFFQLSHIWWHHERGNTQSSAHLSTKTVLSSLLVTFCNPSFLSRGTRNQLVLTYGLGLLIKCCCFQ